MAKYLSITTFNNAIRSLVLIILFSSCNAIPDNSLEHKCAIFSSKFIETETSVLLTLNFNDSVNGKFLFDTGCPYMIIDSAFKHDKLDKSEKFSMLDNLDKKHFKIDSISYEFTRHFQVANLGGHINSTTNGILGTSYFYGYPYRLNFDDSIFSFVACNNLSKYHSEYAMEKIELTDDKIIINATLIINGIEITGPFLFDSGSQTDVVLSRATVAKYKLDTIKNKVYYKSNNFHLYGNSLGFYLSKSKLKIFKEELIAPVVYCSSDSTDPISDYSECRGLIGFKVINKFNFIVTAQHRQIFTQRNKRNFERVKIKGPGIMYSDNRRNSNGIKVSGIFGATDADLKGIQLDDEIISINGIDVNEIESLEIRNLLLNNTDKVSIVFKRNNKIQSRQLACKEILN